MILRRSILLKLDLHSSVFPLLHRMSSTTSTSSIAVEDSYGFATSVIHRGQAPDPSTGAVAIPISLSTTFAQVTPGV